MTSRFSVLVALVFALAQSFGAEPQIDATQLPRIPLRHRRKLSARSRSSRASASNSPPPNRSWSIPLRCASMKMAAVTSSRCAITPSADRNNWGASAGWKTRTATGALIGAPSSPRKCLGRPHSLAGTAALVGATPDIIYFKDTTGDGVADVRETIFTGFAADYAPFATNKLNVQALMNSFNWSLDNRIHGATSFSGGKSEAGRFAVRARMAATRGRFFPGGGHAGIARSRLQLRSAHTRHSRRERWRTARSFLRQSRTQIRLLQLQPRPDADVRRALRGAQSVSSLPRSPVDIAVDGGAAPVFRISPDEPWRVIRTQWRVGGLVPGPIEGGGRPSGYFTGATGVTIYRGDDLGRVAAPAVPPSARRDRDWSRRRCCPARWAGCRSGRACPAAPAAP